MDTPELLKSVFRLVANVFRQKESSQRFLFKRILFSCPAYEKNVQWTFFE